MGGFTFLRDNLEALMLMLSFSLLGGVAQYAHKVKQKKALFSIAELVGEAVISASAGMTTGLLLIDHMSLPMVLAASSLAGHMGTRLIFMLENALAARLKNAIDKG